MGRRNKDWKRLLEPVPGTDWTRVVVHGIFGVVVGAGIGLSFRGDMDGHGSWLIIALPAATVGAVAAVFGDAFWDWITGRWS